MTHLIPLSGTEIVEFVPQFFAQDDSIEAKPTFFIRVPTFAMRDKMAALLFQRGMIPATMSQSRGILIDALYDLYDEATADDHAAFLESYWTRSEVHEELIGAWQIREAQRLFDVAMGADKQRPELKDAEPIPPAPFTMREQARQASIVTYVLDNHERYRAYQARFMVQKEEEEEMLLRLFVDHWTNCGDVQCRRDEMDRIDLGCIEEVRGWLDKAGAKSAWDEVKAAVTAQFGAPGGLEKNYGSPLDTNSSQTGSQTSSGDLATSDGNSTTSPITPTHDTASRRKSGGSRNSRSVKSGSPKAGSAAKRSGQTAAHS